jgi:hypothetical protein
VNAAEPTLAATGPDLRRWLAHYRFGLRGLSLLLSPHAPSAATWAEIILPGGIAASFFILWSRL